MCLSVDGGEGIKSLVDEMGGRRSGCQHGVRYKDLFPMDGIQFYVGS